MTESFRSGFIALIGRPNVGKSTLLNAILEQKIAITAKRQQTTRNKLLGIKTESGCQMIFVDTPGIHQPRHALGEAMVRAAEEALEDIDLVAFVTDAEEPEADRAVVALFEQLKKPVLFVLNKAETRTPGEITEIIGRYGDLFPFQGFLSLSALKAKGIILLLDKIKSLLPEGPRYYDEETITDQYERFMAAEIIREKVIKNTSEEVPHAVAVEIDQWKEKKNGLLSISAVLYVEREGQKGIIIGRKGEMLKTIGSQARQEIERLTGRRIFLELWVKVRKGWRDDRQLLQQLGYR